MPLRLPSRVLVSTLLLSLSHFAYGSNGKVATAAASPVPAGPVLNVDTTAIGTMGPGGLVASYADIIEPVQKAVVTVNSTRTIRPNLLTTGQRRGGLGGGGGGGEEKGLGSGVIISPNGFILTNNHVVEGADKLEVQLNDGRKLNAKVLGADDKTDVAIIKIEAENLPVATLADSDKLRVGDIVFAIGNPLGVGQTVTNGIISATGRSDLGLLDNVDGGYENFIQTDAPINMGNSGGALIDAKGRLVGLNSAIISPSEGSIGIGFSIPINLAAYVMDSMLKHDGRVLRGYLGVKTGPITPEIAEARKLPKDLKGVLVSEVPVDGPSGKAGIKTDDVITSVSGHPIASIQDLRMTVAQLSPNSTVDVKLLRDGKDTTIKVVLAELPETELLPGVTVRPLDEDTRYRYNLDSSLTSGLVVDRVTEGSVYNRQLVSGVVVIKINDQPVNDLVSARKLLHPGDNALNVSYRRTIQNITLNIH